MEKEFRWAWFTSVIHVHSQIVWHTLLFTEFQRTPRTSVPKVCNHKYPTKSFTICIPTLRVKGWNVGASLVSCQVHSRIRSSFQLSHDTHIQYKPGVSTFVRRATTVREGWFEGRSIKVVNLTDFFDVLLTVHLRIFILVIYQLDAQNMFYNKFISCLYTFQALCAHHQEVKIVLYGIWYRHTYWWPSGAQSSLNLCTGRPPIGVMIPETV